MPVQAGEKNVMYSTLMVHLDVYRDNKHVLQVAGDVAERFEASVIGITACQPIQIVYGDGYISGFALGQERDDLEEGMKTLEHQFRSALENRARNLEWRASVTFGSPSDYVASEARCADLVIMSVFRSESWLDTARRANVSDLVMQVGRPVLIAPSHVETLSAKTVVVGWKDTREARRAVADALPFLKKAARVVVVEAADDVLLADAQRNVDDVAAWLKRHGAAAEALALDPQRDATAELGAIAAKENADLIVAGAYGHSRFREWVLGGVTRDILEHPGRCSLVSH